MAELTRRGFFSVAGTAAAALTLAPSAPAQEPQPQAGNAPDKPLKFRLGLVTYNLAANWDLPTLLKICKSVGISPVELRTTHKHGVEPSLSKEQKQNVRKQFADAGIEIWGCGTTCEFHSPDPATVGKNIDSCHQFIELAADLGARGVKVRPNGLPKEIPVEKTLEQIGKSLAVCGKAAADSGLEIWLEVHGAGTAHPPYVKQIMEACGLANVGCTWNSNTSDIKDGSIAEYFHLLRPWIKSCHINELYKDESKTYPYRELFRLFRETGYDRVTMCEVAKSPPDAGSGEELLRYYKALWNELAGP